MDGDLDIVQYLLEEGPNINAQDESGNSALMDAIWGHHTEVARLLISKGAAVNAQMPGQITVYALAVVQGENDLARLLKI